MRPESFGEIVRILRQERRYFEATARQPGYRVLSQEYLAEKAGIAVRTIQRIEQGKSVDLSKYVDALADALELSEAEKEPFYAAAGLHYRVRRPRNDWQEIVRSIIAGYRYPVHCITPLWDIVALNAYNYALFSHSPEVMSELKATALGANLLRLTFDPVFERKRTLGGETQWRDEMIRNLRAFRASALPYVTTTRYNLIISEMYRLPWFDRLWEQSLWPPNEDELTHVRPTTTVHHPQFGVMTFMTLRIPEEYLAQDLYIYGYIPSAASEENFRALQDSIPESDADNTHFFDVPPLDYE